MIAGANLSDHACYGQRTGKLKSTSLIRNSRALAFLRLRARARTTASERARTHLQSVRRSMYVCSMLFLSCKGKVDLFLLKCAS